MEYLNLQGFVSEKVLLKVVENISIEPNEYWLFSEYSPATYGLGTEFSTSDGTILKLLHAVDQFGNFTQEISEGWKMVACFTCESLPSEFSNLPVIDAWTHNPNKITIKKI